MASYIKFTPLSGAKNEDALCYLLEIDEVKILLDCGWSDHFDTKDLLPLKKIAKQIDVVLLSHSDLPHLGAYTYAKKHLGLQCPVYSTVPVVNMGKMCMYDIYQSKTNEMDFSTFTLEDVDNAFDKITPLRFSQPCALPGKCQGIMITAYAAAHTVGGTIWKIKQDTNDIVYAVDFNHRKESHLDGTVLLSDGVVLDPLARPSLLITDSLNADTFSPPRKDRYSAMFDTLNTTLSNGGSVLLPTDSAARVLELAYLLDQQWTKNQLNNYPLIMLSNTSYHTIHFAKVMLEWMGNDLTTHFFQTRENPFEFKYLRLCHKLEDLENYPGPKVVIASNYSLETGFARDLFVRWMTVDTTENQQVKNTLLLTERAPPGSLARQIYDDWEKQAIIKPILDYNTEMDLTLFKRVPLEGVELQQYEAAQRAKEEREAAQAAMIARNKTIMEEDESDTSDLDEADDPMDDLLIKQHDLYVRDSGRSGGFFKQAQSYHMFPYHERRKKFDDYGEAIQPDQYILATDTTRMTAADKNDVDMDLDEPMLPSRDTLPTKYISNVQHVQVQCFLRYIDLEGLSDGRSITKILPQIAPRKMVIIHGNDEPTQNLSQTCLSMNHFTKEIFTPNIGEVLNVSAATNIYRVRLTDGLVNSLFFSKLDDYELARVSGRIHFQEDSTTPSLDVVDDVSSMDVEHMQLQKKKMEPSIFVGDIRLTEFKRVLQAEGISAEFKNEGMLVCNDQVVVRKTGSGQLLVEGVLSMDYYKIRSLLYAQHAIL
ncbi:beta-lactamase-like protein [Absidia repens]|uniref:Cleavage and polyadenylation specificity factor subunit 2 n=1 Tax=Absidia repens TaxID=90262 RepID=A0A1X2HZL2_9FUNG|nr:beta-lactamase-like protein [Absidia repens]